MMVRLVISLVTDIFKIGSRGIPTIAGCLQCLLYGVELCVLSSQLEIAACGACQVE